MDLTQRAQVLHQQADEIAATLVSAVWGHLPGYDDARMDVEDLSNVVALNVRALLTAVAARRLPRGEELAPAAALGQRRAIQGVPVEGVVASWHAAERELLERFAAAGPPLDTVGLIDLSHRLASATDTLAEASIDAYRTTRTESAGHLDQIATDLVSRLAGGEPLDPADVEERARLVGVPAQVPHRAAAIGLPPNAGALALTRAQRIILDAVTPRLRSRLLVGARGSTLLLVLADSPGIADAFARAATRPGVPEGLVIGLGEPRPRLGEAGGSCREAVSALEAGLRMRADRVVVPFERVVPEVLLLGNPLDARLLADTILRPLRPSPALIETLRVFLTAGLSTRVTAQRLSIHENTVSYRIRRILTLLGAGSAADLVRPDILLALRAEELLPYDAPRVTPG
ncbi:PucR family transcriptional regulator [Spongiactinospora sp. 9N601]|uniref:PucR family transcriptional regulator n=1 Tax=Spongiactinospora sp. 9N601 TaxID=3375149 RepID=UPI00379AA7E1